MSIPLPSSFRVGVHASPIVHWGNADTSLQETARRLYGHIDNLELYVGLQAEQAKPPRIGAGLCPGYTISRALLADAVSLTRGDRFLTTDLTRA